MINLNPVPAEPEGIISVSVRNMVTFIVATSKAILMFGDNVIYIIEEIQIDEEDEGREDFICRC